MNTTSFVRPATETLEGAGVTVRRLFPLPRFHNFDPFVLWDHFDIAPGTGFPEHPHRGFEAITYLFDGSMEHADNLGNRSTVNAGGAQRFTAGRGLVHSEMPGSGKNTGIQLWINLPGRLKGIEPAYQQVDAGAFPRLPFDGGEKKIIVGEGSPLKLLTPVEYSEIRLQPGARRTERLQAGFNGLLYLLQGQAQIDAQTVAAGSACFVQGRERLEISSDHGCRLMFCQGLPHGEPIHQHGPYVD